MTCPKNEAVALLALLVSVIAGLELHRQYRSAVTETRNEDIGVVEAVAFFGAAVWGSQKLVRQLRFSIS